MAKIVLLVGARPNYMKIAPLWRAMQRRGAGLEPVLIHTEQHYDEAMSKVFFDDLGLPRPDLALGVGSGSHGVQTGRVMIALEPVLQAQRPALLVVVGDVNSTVAGALVGVKLGIPVAHVEAGLRSFDRTMPEEINRIVTDAISHCLLTSCADADENLRNEGIAPDRIHLVGNIMIDSLVDHLPRAAQSAVLGQLNLAPRRYIAVTLHRPSNVDDPEKLREILAGLEDAAQGLDVVFPVHPRTRKMIERMGWAPRSARFLLTEPFGYLDFLRLMSQAALAVTDSGGIQEETSYLGIPCLTVRENTERPITVAQGTNRLIHAARADIVAHVAEARQRIGLPAPLIPLWDGQAADRILDVLQPYLVAG